MSFDRALTFDCGGERLVGVLSEPKAPARVGVVMIVGGPQYRAGSHRQFVLLARALAVAGFAVLRFDYRGMGDSTGPQHTFEDVVPDIAAAINVLQREYHEASQIVLWGLCDAASAALLYWHETHDARLAGLALLNPWVRSTETVAKTRLKHYYGQRLRDRGFWLKLTRGGINVPRALKSMMTNVAVAAKSRGRLSQTTAFQGRMAEGLRSFVGPVLILRSERDLTAQEFHEYARSAPDWRGLLSRRNVAEYSIPDADHTFSTVGWRREVETRTLEWLRRILD